MLVFPQLHSERLRLRKITVEDIDSLVKYANNKSISNHIINIPHPYREPDAMFRLAYVFKGFESRNRFIFSIELKEIKEFIGEVSLHLDEAKKEAQIAYWIGEPFWGKGIATEAINMVLKFGFEHLELNRIFASCNIENVASQKILVKNQMKRCGVTGKLLQFSLRKEEYV